MLFTKWARFCFICTAHFLLLFLTKKCVADGERMIPLNLPISDGETPSAYILSDVSNPGRAKVKKYFPISKVWWMPRVKTFTADIDDKTKTCFEGKNEPAQVPATRGGIGYCKKSTDYDKADGSFLTDRKKWLAQSACADYVVPAFRAHTLFRQVTAASAPISSQVDPICAKFNFNQSPGIDTIKDAEILFYASATPMDEKERDLHIWTHVCPTRKDQPLVVVANMNPERLSENMGENAMIAVKTAMTVRTCHIGFRIIERTDTGFDKDKSLCITFQCDQTKGENKTVYYTHSNANPWKTCTDARGIPLKNLTDSVECPSWYELCSGVMEKEFTQTFTAKETQTVSQTVSQTHTITPTRTISPTSTVTPTGKVSPTTAVKPTVKRTDDDYTDSDSKNIFNDHSMLTFEYV